MINTTMLYDGEYHILVWISMMNTIVCYVKYNIYDIIPYISYFNIIRMINVTLYYNLLQLISCFTMIDYREYYILVLLTMMNITFIMAFHKVILRIAGLDRSCAYTIKLNESKLTMRYYNEMLY